MLAHSSPSVIGDHAVEPRAEGNEGDPQVREVGGRHACFQRDVAEAQQEGRRDTGELDPGLPADRARATVTAGQVPGSQLAVPLRAVELDVHAFSVLVRSGELVTAPDLHAEFARVVVQDLLGGRLLDEQSAQAKVACFLQVQRDQGEVRGVRYPRGGAGLEAAEQAPVVEGVYRPPDQRKCLGQPCGFGQPLQHHGAHPGQVQLAGQHEAGRPGPGDNDISVH
jgi:hypothetical protein